MIRSDLHDWHCVFAWLPIDTSDGHTVWLETCDRRLKPSGHADYRISGSEWDNLVSAHAIIDRNR
jgi:hypothetical protein